MAARAMRLAAKSGISLKTAWARVRSHDPVRYKRFGGGTKKVESGPRGGYYFRSYKSNRKRYDPAMTSKKKGSRRHDPKRFGAARGVGGKVLNGLATMVGGYVGGKAGAIVKGVAPMNVNLGGKAWNIPDIALSVAAGGFGPSGGLMGHAVQGFAGGVGSTIDPPTYRTVGGTTIAPSYSGAGSVGV